MSVILVTDTGTDVGKTISTVILAVTLHGEGKEVHVVKPIQTGLPDPDGGDLDIVAELTGVDNLRGLERYPEPMAPVATVQRAGACLPSATEIAEKIGLIDGSNRIVLVEGAGGLLVGLGEDWALLELAGLSPGSQMAIVARLGLGCLSEAELTVEVTQGRGTDITVLAGGSLPVDVDPVIETNLEELPRVTGVPLLGSVQAEAGASDRWEFVVRASQWLPGVREWTVGLQIEAAWDVVKLAFCEKCTKVVR